MAKAKKTPGNSRKKPIEQYAHKGKQRANNPPVGLVTPATDKESGKKTYGYDPHLDPQLVWAGKAKCRPCRCTSTSASTRAPSSRRCAGAMAATINK